MSLELNHKLYPIYGEGNKSVEIQNPKEVQILINDEPNGATLHDIFKKIDDFEEGKIFGWSILEYYKAQDGYLCDNEGNRISLMEGETRIFFRNTKDPLIILAEKEVSLDYVKDVSSLLGLNVIEETITGLSNGAKELLIAEREEETARREEEKNAKIKEQKRKQEEEEERTRQEEAKLKAEQEEAERVKKEQEEAERLKQEEEERAKQEAEAKKMQEEEHKKNENMVSAKDFRDTRKGYEKDGYSVFTSEDEKYFFFYSAEEEDPNHQAFLFARRKNEKSKGESDKYLYEELAGDFDEDLVEFSFNDEGEDKVVILDQEAKRINVEIVV